MRTLTFAVRLIQSVAIVVTLLLAAPSMGQTIINVPANQYCTINGQYLETLLPPGMYRMEPVGPGGGGLFSGYHGAGGVSTFCNPDGYHCYQGWLWELIYQIGYFDWPNIINSGPCGQCETAEQALACLPPGTHADFTISGATVQRLSIQTACAPSVGGISVRITPRLAFTSGPAPVEMCPGGVGEVSVTAAGEGVPTFRWEWQEVALPGIWNALAEGDNTNHQGATVFSAENVTTGTVTLRDNHLQGGVDVIQSLRCIITSSVGSVASLPGEITLLAPTDPRCGRPPCDGDVNCDFALDGFDVEVQEKAVGGDITDYCQPDPDFNGDFALDGFDVEAVELVIGGGPCP